MTIQINCYKCRNILIPMWQYFLFSYSSNILPFHFNFPSRSTSPPFSDFFREFNFWVVDHTYTYWTEIISVYFRRMNFLNRDRSIQIFFKSNWIAFLSSISFKHAWHKSTIVAHYGGGNKLYQLWPMVSRQASSHDSSCFLSDEIRYQWWISSQSRPLRSQPPKIIIWQISTERRI